MAWGYCFWRGRCGKITQMSKVIDWTQYLVAQPTTQPAAAKPQTAKLTQVWRHFLPSKPKPLPLTDFAKAVAADQQLNPDEAVGTAFSISLALPAGYTLAQLTEQMGLSQQTTPDGAVYYQVSLGEYPQTAVTDERLAALADRLNSYDIDENVPCTGRWYTTIAKERSSALQVSYPKLNSEFIYQGQKYVYRIDVKNYGLFDKDFVPQWYKIEPITFRVTNYAAVASGQARQIDLVATHALGCGVTATEFLTQALNMTRKPSREYTVPTNTTALADYAFAYCYGLEKIIFPEPVAEIRRYAFEQCPQAQIWVGRTQNFKELGNCLNQQLKNLYLPKTKDEPWVVFSPSADPRLAVSHQRYPQDAINFCLRGDNYRTNYLQIVQWQNEHKIKFTPPDFTLKIFPAGEMANYFVNNNHKRWAELVKTLHFNEFLTGDEKENDLPDLMKIYYALGGFSANQGARDQAFNYMVQHVATLSDEEKVYLGQFSSQYNPPEKLGTNWIAQRIHADFSRLELTGPYHPTFAQFFMRYYHTNPDFMRFEFDDRDGLPQDYLCAAHNTWGRLLQNFPNRVVNGNTQRNLLSPRFVAEHCVWQEYDNVAAGNEPLATLVGRYGYTPEQFTAMQTIFDQAKQIKDQSVLRAELTVATNGIAFRMLSKDDPLGFVLGDLTNCCQVFGGVGESCVSDGYTNPYAGFAVWERVADQRLLGQAYVWYDPVTQTVCYDNIEIPDRVLAELKQGTKQHGQLSLTNLMQAVINAADAIMTTMNRNGTKVERVTVGSGYNDLGKGLAQRFKLTTNLAIHRDYYGYTDAKYQYLIRTYAETMAAATTPKLTTVIIKPTRDQARERQ